MSGPRIVAGETEIIQFCLFLKEFTVWLGWGDQLMRKCTTEKKTTAEQTTKQKKTELMEACDQDEAVFDGTSGKREDAKQPYQKA